MRTNTKHCAQCGVAYPYHDTACDYAPTATMLEEALVVAQHELEKAPGGSYEHAKNLCEAYLDAYYSYQTTVTTKKG